MITSIHFENFKILRDATLPLGRFTLLIGANGSGKSTAMQALRFIGGSVGPSLDHISVEVLPVSSASHSRVSIMLETADGSGEVILDFATGPNGLSTQRSVRGITNSEVRVEFLKQLETFRIFQFEPKQMTQPQPLAQTPELGEDGSHLAVVLDALRDSHPERFELLNQELGRWLPEFDRILFETIGSNRAFMLRTRFGSHPIRAAQLSQGTLLALAFLTTAYLPQPPAIICFEEPEHGIHPRLLREIQDAMYRLAYPENYGEERAAVQVIATTHSPYLLDLYKDHPEEIVIAEKTEQGAGFRRLTDTPHLEDILQGAPLGEVWYSGIFGGMPLTA